MAFTITNVSRKAVSGIEGARIFEIEDLGEVIADIDSAYFSTLDGPLLFDKGDLIAATGSDGSALLIVTNSVLTFSVSVEKLYDLA